MVEAIRLVIQPEVLGLWMVGMFFGIFVGAIPGLTATMATAILVPITYYLSPLAGLSMIVGCVCVAIFAGHIPAIYMRVPGTPTSGAVVLDGYEMTKQGKSAQAMRVGLIYSVMGGLVGFSLLIIGATALAAVALKFSFYEFFWLAIFGLSTSIVMSRGTLAKGAIAVAIGLFVSTIGIDIISGYPRFSFGSIDLLGGVSFIPAMIGLFGIPVILRTVAAPQQLSLPAVIEKEKFPPAEIVPIIKKNVSLFFKSSLVGAFIGFLPGAGADIGAWVSYGMAKRGSKQPEKYGTGCVEGVIAPASAGNAGLGGAWIPALALGIPGDSITAIILGAAMIYGLRPGPMIFEGPSGDLVRGLFIIALLTQFMLIPMGYLGIKTFGTFFKLPNNIIMPTILIFCIVGSYALRFSMFDVGIMLFFGFLGYFMERNEMPLAPLVLAIILGPLIERNLRTGLMKTGGSVLPFFIRPIAILVIMAILLFVFWPNIENLIMRLRGKGKN